MQASAFLKGQNPSWPSAASHTLESGSPTAPFVSESPTGPAGGYNPVPCSSAIPTGTVAVHYSVVSPTGGTTTRSVGFLPGNNCRYLPITEERAGFLARRRSNCVCPLHLNKLPGFYVIDIAVNRNRLRYERVGENASDVIENCLLRILHRQPFDVFSRTGPGSHTHIAKALWR